MAKFYSAVPARITRRYYPRSVHFLALSAFRVFRKLLTIAIMYLRFQTMIPDPKSGRSTGILVAGHHLRDSNRISVADEKWLREYLSYFNEHLKIPACLKEPDHRRAISWFKEGSEMIDRVWALKVFLEEYDIFIDFITTRSPVYLIYEDGHQVVAKPGRKI